MAFFSWSGWFKSLLRPQVKPIRRRSCSLGLERLEDRLVPATDIWSGAAGTNWSLAGSWSNGVPQPGDDLVFPTGASQFSTNNNLAAGTIFNSISLQGDTYLLAGNRIQLGSPTASGNSGYISVNSNLFNETISLNVTLGGAGAGGAGQQVFTVNANSQLIMSGKLSGTTGVGMAKQGAGTLTLSGDNTGFNGAITVVQGALKVANSAGLGDTSQGTVVQQNAQLQVSDTSTGTPISVNEALILNGPGPNNLGAMYNVSGANTWSGNIQLGSDTTFGAAAPAFPAPATQVTITGSITNLGGGHNVTKEGPGTVAFAAANNYNGATIVNNGVLQISNDQALGIADGTLFTGTTVNQNQFATKYGTLQLTGGITVVNDLLTLNGIGYNGAPAGSIAAMGALNNLSGANVWTGNVILGSLAPNDSDVLIRADSTAPANNTSLTDSLTITGVIQDPNAPGTNLAKSGFGLLIFTNSNTYTGRTDIRAGVLEITDSQALGQDGFAGRVTVRQGTARTPVPIPGATLELSVVNPFKTVDSITGTTNSLLVSTPMTIAGFGALEGGTALVAGAPIGALYSASGINIYSGNMTIPDNTPAVSVGVDADPNASSDNTYYTSDYSLTITGELIGPNQPPGSNPSGPGKESFSFGEPTTPLFQKRGAGQLILPNANDRFGGPTDIAQGWITIQNSDSLGPNVANVGQNLQPTVTVDAGAALHLNDVLGTGLTLHQNLTLFGLGLAHPFAQINRQGALENVRGANTVTGNVTLGVSSLNGSQSGIGVEKVFGPSQLTIAGPVTDQPPLQYLGEPRNMSFDENIIETGSPKGTITFAYNFPAPFPQTIAGQRIDVYDGLLGLGGTPASPSGFPVTPNLAQGSGAFQVAWNNNSVLDVFIGLPPAFNFVFPTLVLGSANYTATVTPQKIGPGGITKLGSQLLILQGTGDYTGAVDIQQGVLLDQSNSGLGAGNTATSITTVETGAALVLANSVPYANGSIQANAGVLPGIDVIGEKLVLNGLGNTSLNGTPIGALSVWSDTSMLIPGSGFITPNDVQWRGPVSLKTATSIEIGTNSRLDIHGAIDDASNASNAGSDLIKVGPGELMLSSAGTYRGNTYIGTNSAAGNPGFNPDGANVFYSGNATTAQAGGVLTVSNSQALGVPTGGVVVQQGSAIQLQGNITVAGKSLTVAGQGDAVAPTATPSWLSVGPSAVTGAQTPGMQTVSGRITGVAVDPSDPNTIYVAAAGGGAWKTVNGGRSWVQIFDGVMGMFTGAIAVAPSSPNVIYLGTGEDNNSGDSYYGTGIYKSIDNGHTWTLLQDPSLVNQNPLMGKVVSKIVVDANNPNIMYAGVSDNPQMYIPDPSYATDAPPFYSNDIGGTNGGAGVWRYNSTLQTWLNLTSTVSDVRVANNVAAPGPNDNLILNFPQANADYSDLTLTNGTLYLALGSPGQGPQQWQPGVFYYGANYFNTNLFDGITAIDPASMNAVYRCLNPATALNAPGQKPRWYVGDQIDAAGGGSKQYPNLSANFFDGSLPPKVQVSQGTIKIASFQNLQADCPPPLFGLNTIYALNVQPYDGPGPNIPPGSGVNGFLSIIVSQDSGKTWNATPKQPAVNFLAAQGSYDVTIAVVPTANFGVDHIYVGGADSGTGTNYVLHSPDGGNTWLDITVDSKNVGPHTDMHATAVDQLGQIYFGGDGGIWQLQTLQGNTWNDLNSNLNTIQFNGIAISLSNPDIIFGGSQDNGTERSNSTITSTWDSNNQPWQWVGDGDGGQLAIDPSNPNNVYRVVNGNLVKSTTGGGPNSFGPTAFPGSQSLYLPLVIDPLKPDRLVAGGTINAFGLVEETLDGGNSFTNMNVPFALADVEKIALAQYQGAFVADTAFPLVADKGTNTYLDGDTLYITGLDYNSLQLVPGQFIYDLFVTKDHGITWVQRSLPVTNGIGDMTVDPRNRDTIYVVTNTFTGAPGAPQAGGHVFVSLDAGQTWSDITNNLPDLPMSTIVVDPRTEDLYVGTDQGVYASTNAGATWQLFGAGMPLVQITDLVIDPSSNTLTAASYGRGAWRATLNGTQNNAGGLSVVAGSAEWTGPIFLSGPTSIGVYGTQSLRDGSATAQLNIIGNIADLTAGANYPLTKIGVGTLTLSGVNTYGGTTDIQKGVVIADNPLALGGTVNGTTVEAGAALQLESSILGEPLILNGDGVLPAFNDHRSGALESIANNNTYTGNITLNTSNVTIGVDSGSTLTITGIIDDGGNNYNLIKELNGTLVLDDLAGNNTYGGATLIYQGVLEIESSGALFGSSGATVLDGAQLILQTPTTGPNAGVPVVITGKTLDLTGSGIFGSGALLSIGGNNTWAGPIKLDASPAFAALSYPVGVVTFGVPNAADILTIAGPISEVLQGGTAIASGLGKVGFGTLVLQQADSYTGTTYINKGTIRIQNSGALGGTNTNDIQRVTVFDASNPPTGTFQLLYNGQPTAALPSTASAAQVQTALNNLLASEGVNGTVSVTRNLAPITGSALAEVLFTIVFQGGLAGMNIPQLIVLVAGGTTATVSKVADGGIGTLVKNGAVLALDLDPLNTGTPHTVNGEALHITGTGISGAGALRNVSGNNTWAGAPITLDTSSPIVVTRDAIGVDAGTSLKATNASAAAVSGLPAAELDKVGTGTLIFATANDYQGTTVVMAGILDIQNNLALGGSITNEMQTLTLSGAPTGTFRLSFKGSSQTPARQVQSTSGAQIQADLEALSTIGVGNVLVTPSSHNVAGLYTITFVGALAGAAQPKLVATAASGAQAVVNEIQPGGLGDTQVQAGATLQLEKAGGGLTVSTELLHLNGPGFNNLGALDSKSGANTWATPIVLDTSSAIGVDADSGATPGLTINQPISGPAAATTLTKVGSATLNLTAANTYTGTTFVNNGVLLLADNGGQAVPHDLVVGDSLGAPLSATARLMFGSELLPTANVTVNSDGLFDLNGKAQTLNALTIIDGKAQTGVGGQLSLTAPIALNMTGGNLNQGATGQTTLGGNVTATSDATGPATINGPGVFSMGGTARTFTVSDGPAGVDLDVQMPITGPGTPGLTKAGPGRMELDAVNAYGLTTVTGGDVQVDGVIGDVVLAGGGVSGTGTTATHGQIGRISGAAGGTPNGTVSPGDNSAVNPIGTLTTNPAGTETWGGQTTFFVNLDNAASGPGVGNDVLIVNGNLNLGAASQIAGGGGNNGGAILGGTVSVNVNVGDSFTIIQTINGGTITGFFNEPFSNNTVFIGGAKFTVAYFSDHVVLTRQINNATLSVTSSANPAVFGQDVTFTATLTPEPGASQAFLPTDQITFNLYDSMNNLIATDVENVNTANGTAMFDATQAVTLSPGFYTLTASFPGDANYNPATLAMPFSQEVRKANTTIGLTPSTTTPVYGQQLTITATIAPVSPGAGIPTGTVRLFVDGGAANSANGGFEFDTAFDSSFGGVVPINLPVLNPGPHTFAASYLGDVNFNPKSTTNPPLSVTIAKDSVTMQLGANPPSPAVVGQNVTFTATITTNGPGTGVPTGSVSFFYDVTHFINTTPINNGVAFVNTSTLPIGVHTITAKYPGNQFTLANSATINYTVNKIGTTTSVTSSTGPNPAAFGQTVTFTASVLAVAPGGGVPTGTVTFTDSAGSFPATTIALDGNGRALYSTNTLSVTTHTIKATYNGANNYATSFGTVSEQVLYSSATTLASSKNPSGYGESVTFTATVRPGVNQPGPTPTGTVDFFIDNNDVATVTLNGAGMATYTTSTLTIGGHSVVAQYSGSPTTYGASTSNALTQNVRSSSTVTVTRTIGSSPALYGEPLQFTATVDSVPAGSPTPTGSVKFFDGGTLLGTKPLVNGVATLDIANLPKGNHNISATYAGDAVTQASNSTVAVAQTINQGTTTTTVMTSGSPSVVGQTVTFSGTVSPNAPSTLAPTGTVTIVFNGNTGNPHPVPVMSNGTYSFSTMLPQGTYNVDAKYSDPAQNYANSSASLTQVVKVGTTTTLRDAPSNPVLFNVPVTLGGTVNRPANNTVPFSGTLHFVDTTTNTDFGTFPVDQSSGKAQAPAGTFTTGVHHLTATYSGDNNFVGSVGVLDLVVQSGTSVGLIQTAGSNPSVYSETLTYQATVNVDDGTTQPTGSVSFYFQGGLLTTVNLPANSNTVSASFSNLVSGMSAYQITARYNGNALLVPSTSPAISQTINVDPTTTQVTSSVTPSTYGQNVTWTATVMKTGAATQTPNGGTVNFQIGNGGIHSVPLVNGTASFSANNVAVGSYTVTASYLGLAQKFGASSGTVSQTVNAASTSTTVTSSANPSGAGQTVTFTATVQNTSGSVVPTGGTVTFTVDNVNQAPVAMSNGIATFAMALQFGNHTIQATYNGAPNFNPSPPSAVLTQVVNNPSQTTLVSSRNPSTAGDPVTFTATVTHSSGAPTPTGSVNFYDGSTFLATQPLNGNQAMFTTSGLAIGTHTIVAKYTGDSNYAVSRGIVTQQVYAPVASITANLTTPPANNDGVNNPFRIDGYARDANGNTTVPPAPAVATLSVASGPGTFKSGNTTATFSGGSWAFMNLELTVGGVYTLRITYGSFTADIVIDTGRLT